MLGKVRKILSPDISRKGTYMSRGMRLGDVILVENMKKKPAAAAKYNHLRVQFPDGCERRLLFTDSQIRVALERAKKNPEDLPPVSWIRDAFD